MDYYESLVDRTVKEPATKTLWYALFGTQRNTVITLTVLSAILIFTPVVIRTGLREAGYSAVDTHTETMVAAISDSARKYQLNYTLTTRRYIHPGDTAKADVFLVRTTTHELENADNELLHALLADKSISHVDAELEAPSFTVLRVTPRETRARRFWAWQFLLTPKPNVEGIQMFVYRIRMLDEHNKEISYTSHLGSIDIGTSPFAPERISTAIGIVSGVVGIYLQFTKK